MAVLTLQDASNGLAPIMGAAANGDQIPAGVEAGGWQLGVALLIRNGDTTATTVTVAGIPGLSVPPTNALGFIPVFAMPYGKAIDITYSKVVSLFVAAVRLTGPLE